MADVAFILAPFSVSSRIPALQYCARSRAQSTILSAKQVSPPAKLWRITANLSLYGAPVSPCGECRQLFSTDSAVWEFLCRRRSSTKKQQRFCACTVRVAPSLGGLRTALDDETRDNLTESSSHEVRPPGPQEDGQAEIPKVAKSKVYAPARQAARKIFQDRLKGSEILEAVGAAGLQLGVRTMNVLIHELGNLNDYEGAVESFKAFRGASVQPNHIVCTTLIFILGKGRRLPQAQQVFEWGLQQLQDPPPDLFHTFIITCAKCRNPDAASDAFAVMQRRRIKPGRVAYMGLVSAFFSGGQPEEAQEWLSRMTEQGIEPGPVDYEAMLAACARARRAGDAAAIFDRMRKLGVDASPVSYNSLLSAYERCGMWRDALRLLLDMERPDDVAWCTTLSACAKAGKASVAMELLKRMQATGIAPCVVAWSCVVEAHRRSGDWQGAESAVQAMMAAGVAPNEVTWGSLMACYAVGGETDRAIAVLDRAVAPGVVLWTSAIAFAGGVPEKARSLFARMMAAGCKPNVATFSALIKACGNASDWEGAEVAFQDMLAARLRPNAVACAALLRAYANGRQLGRAGSLFRRMSRLYGVQPDKYAYTALVRACGLCRDWQRAEAVFLHMQTAGIAPDGVVYQELLRAYEAEGQIEKAIHLMDTMATTLS